MRTYLNSLFVFMLNVVSVSVFADTLMVQVSVSPEGQHELVRMWDIERTIKTDSIINSDEDVIIIRTYDDRGHQTKELHLPDTWTKLSKLSPKAQVDYRAPESYIIKIPDPNNIARVEVVREHENQPHQILLDLRNTVR